MTSIPTPSGTNRSGSRLPISTPVSQNTSMLRPPSVLPLGKPSIVGSKRLRGSDGAEEAVSGAPKRPREALKRSNYAFWFIFSRFPCISFKIFFSCFFFLFRKLDLFPLQGLAELVSKIFHFFPSIANSKTRTQFTSISEAYEASFESKFSPNFPSILPD